MRRRDKYKYTLLSALVGTGALLGTGLYLLNPVRHRLANRTESLSDRAKDVYGIASGHIRRASQAITGQDRSHLRFTAALLLGVGVGIGLGVLLAPASGKEVRRNIADKAQDFGGRLRSRVSSESPENGTATA
jgi:hypothetical protein